MNKKILALILAVGMVAGSQAFASRARLLVLGTGDAGQALDTQGNGGSFLTEDAYNMFYNPSYVNEYKDWAIVEKTGGPLVSGETFTANGVNPSQTAVTSTTQRAEGGFVTGIANLNLGLYMNRVTQLENWTQANALNMHPIDLTIGGDMGVKWGLGLSYANFKKEDKSNTNLDVRFGAQVEGFDPFISFKAIGNEKVGVDKKHKDMSIGTRYHYGEWTPYLMFRQSKYDGNTTRNALGLGTARKMKVAEGVRVEYGFGLWKRSNKSYTTNTTGFTRGHNRLVIPVDVAVEGDATSWLTLRGGVSYNLWDREQGNTSSDVTTGRLGAGLHFGKMTFDWAIGSTAGTENLDGQTFDFANGLFSAASLSYNW